jgi:hypothetical protein
VNSAPPGQEPATHVTAGTDGVLLEYWVMSSELWLYGLVVFVAAQGADDAFADSVHSRRLGMVVMIRSPSALNISLNAW